MFVSIGNGAILRTCALETDSEKKLLKMWANSLFVSTLILRQFSRSEAKSKDLQTREKKLAKKKIELWNNKIWFKIFNQVAKEEELKWFVAVKFITRRDEAVSEPPLSEKFLQFALSFCGSFFMEFVC